MKLLVFCNIYHGTLCRAREEVFISCLVIHHNNFGLPLYVYLHDAEKMVVQDPPNGKAFRVISHWTTSWLYCLLKFHFDFVFFDNLLTIERSVNGYISSSEGYSIIKLLLENRITFPLCSHELRVSMYLSMCVHSFHK